MSVSVRFLFATHRRGRKGRRGSWRRQMISQSRSHICQRRADVGHLLNQQSDLWAEIKAQFCLPNRQQRVHTSNLFDQQRSQERRTRMQRQLPASAVVVATLTIAMIACGGNASPTASSTTPPATSAPPSSQPPSTTPTGTTPPSTTPPATTPPTTTPPTTTPPTTTPPTTTPPTPAPASAASFVYVSNNGSDQQVGGSVSGYRVNPASGSLTPIAGSPFKAGDGPSAIGADQNGRFVFVAEDHSVPGARGSNCTLFQSVLLVESVNAGSGALTQTGSKTLDGSCARAVVVDPSSHDVYVGMERFSNSGGEIQGFSVAADGTLTELPGSPYVMNGLVSGLAMHPNGRYVYAASDSGLLVIDRDPTTGALVERGAFNTPKNRLALSPDGSFLTASESSSNAISQFHVDATTGNIEALDARPPAMSPYGVGADPLGKYFAVSEIVDQSTQAGAVSTFYLNPDTHELEKTSGSPFASGKGTIDVSFDPSGSYLYSVNRQEKTVSGFALDRSSGKLTPVSQTPFPVGDFPDGIVIVKGQ